ncbi:hypothetical protein RND71_005322 [Anisodus tanguticus]|uniref:GST C-terminal domain-containing protein n=1 Tax=Anisodus tanguticus TaxID=243964 RepID=A0AAE1SRT1_9SOLA|nr:hypothetical protein RND71_005322 [Anisodus tanguticus]
MQKEMVNSRNLQSIQEEYDNLQHIEGRGNKESEEGERQEVEEIGEEETGDNMKDSANNVTESSSLPTAIKNHPGIDLIVDLNDNLMETYCIQDKEGDVENDFIHKEEEEVRRDQEEEEENQEVCQEQQHQRNYVHSSNTRVNQFILNNEWDIQSLREILQDYLCVIGSWQAMQAEGEAKAKAIELFAFTEKQIQGKKFFGGEQIGYLDLVMDWKCHWLSAMEEVGQMKLLDQEKLPSLHQWAENFKQIPIIHEVMPPQENLVNKFQGGLNYLRSLATNKP